MPTIEPSAEGDDDVKVNTVPLRLTPLLEAGKFVELFVIANRDNADSVPPPAIVGAAVISE